MKSSYLVLFFSFLFINSVSYSQSKKELEFELKLTKAKLDSIQNLYFQQQSQYQQKIVYLESIIDIEIDIVKKYLNPITKKYLVDILYNEFLIKKCNNLLLNESSGINYMLDNNLYEDLYKIYSLYNNYNKELIFIVSLFKKYITKNMVKISYIFCSHILLYSNTCQII
jgi:hypothetical protein